MRSVLCALALATMACLLAGCSDPPATPAAAPTPAQMPLIEHDFGVIPHGESRSHDFVVDTSLLATRCVPLRIQLDCSCGHGQLVLRHKNGTERILDGSPNPDNVPSADETLIARVRLDTVNKPAVDLPKTTSHGYVVLQPVADRDGTLRTNWQLRLHFGIDAPVVLRPFAEFDFGSVPVAGNPEILTTLAGDEQHANVQFGPVESSDPAITVTLEPHDGKVNVRARCKPGELGSYRAVVAIHTDLPSGYRVNLGVTWKVVPNVVAFPMPKLTFRAHLGREQRPDEASSQYLLVTDHDLHRRPEFIVQQIVADDGRDAASSFSITLEPVPGQLRQQRMFVRYLGGQPNGFRGRIVLGKEGEQGPLLSIELVTFPAKDA